jgi:hypothetical protein
MKEIISFNIHSFIDVITNSSTEIYVISKEKLKENLFDIIESLKFIADSDIPIREIFEIGISNDGGEAYVEVKDEEWYDDQELDYPDWIKNTPEMVEKVQKSLKALFSLKSVDYY